MEDTATRKAMSATATTDDKKGCRDAALFNSLENNKLVLKKNSLCKLVELLQDLSLHEKVPVGAGVQ